MSVGQATRGIVTLTGDRTFHYRTNNPYFEGTDSFTYTVSDGHGGTATNTVTVAVVPTPVTAAPTQSAAEAGPDGATVPGFYTLTRPAESTLYELKISVGFLGTGDGVASPWSDYDNGAGVMEATFPAGATTTTLTLPAHKDNFVEGTEAIRSVFRPGSGYRVNGSGADAPVDLDLYDDPPVVRVEASANAAETDPEGAVVSGWFTLTRTGGDPSVSLGVSLRLDGTATYDDDFTIVATVWTEEDGWHEVTLNPTVDGGVGVAFEPGEMSKVLTVVPKKDNRVEGTEGVGVEVRPGGYVVGNPGAAAVDLADDPPVVTVRTKAVQDPEGTEGPEAAAEAGPSGVTTGRFVLARTGGKVSDSLGVRVRFTGGSAGYDADYTVELPVWTAETGEWATATLAPDEDGWVDLTFAADESELVLTVRPKKDNRVEGTETVRVEVGSGGTSCLVGDPGAAVMDLRDDPPVVVIETDELSIQEGQTGEIELRRNGGDLTKPLTVILNVQADDDDGATLWEPDGVSKAETVGTVKVTFPAYGDTVKATVIPEIDMEEHVARRLLVSVEDDSEGKYLAGVDNEATIIVTELPEAGWEGAYWDWVEDWQLNGWMWLDDEFVLLGHPAWTTPGEDVLIQEWASSQTDTAQYWWLGGWAGNPPDSTLAGTDILADGWDRLTKRTEGMSEEVYFVRIGSWSGKPITDPIWVGSLVTIGQTQYVGRDGKFVTLNQLKLRVENRGWWWQNSGRTHDQWDAFFAMYDAHVTSSDDRVKLWKDVDAGQLISNMIQLYGNEAQQLVTLMQQTPYEVVHSTNGGYGSYRLAGLGASYRIEIDDYYRGGLYSRSLRDASDALFQALKEYKPQMEAAKIARKALEDRHLGGEGRMRVTESEAQYELLEARWDGKVWVANEVTRAAIQGAATAVGVAAGTIPWDRVATFMWNRGLALKKGNLGVIERATGRDLTKKEMDDCAREYFRQEQLYTQRATVIVRATAPTAAAKMVEQMAELICFARDTLVATADGLKSIGTIQPGERVRAFDFEAGRWVLAEVEKRHDNVYVGPVITLRAGETSLETTVNHPFWVVEGEGLAARETPGELEPGEDEGRSLPGRWVNSQDVRVGDVVQTRDGRRLVVTGMEARDEEAFPVSNLTVRDHHSYAVGLDGVLVHNGSHWCSIYKRARPVPQSLLNAIERLKIKNPLIHAHHIVMKGDFEDWNAVDRAYVTGARDILARCEIKALRTEGELSAAVAAGDGLENMCWALHYHGNIHSQKYAKWVYDKLSRAEVGGADAVKKELKRMASQMERGETPWL